MSEQQSSIELNSVNNARHASVSQSDVNMEVGEATVNGQFDLNILNHRFLKANIKHVLEVGKSTNNITDLAMNECKVLKFTLEYKLLEILDIIAQIPAEKFRKLFVLIIENENFGFLTGNSAQLEEYVGKLTGILASNYSPRPFLIQLTSTSEKTSKIIYKKEGASIFNDISMAEHADEFVFFLQKFMNGDVNNFDETLADQIIIVPESTLIIRFLQIYSQLDVFFYILRIKCAEKGTKVQFFAALDDPFDGNGRILDIETQNMIRTCFQSEQSGSTSLLLTAIKYQNLEVVDYLVNCCTHLIQELPFDHQLQITTFVYSNGQNDILSDLLTKADFPFPLDFNKYSINHTRLNQIVRDRINFFEAINNENSEVIKNFIDNNMNLKIVYNFDNSSALKQALTDDKVSIYCLLKSYGFQSAQTENLETLLDVAKRQQITKWNAENSSLVENKSISLLESRSFIYNKNISKETEKGYKTKIKEWYGDIYKTFHGQQLFDVAAQCEDLKVIYDFESELVNNIDVTASADSYGFVHLNTKWIFIGARTANREHIIKGTIAHEFCHYVLNMVFENIANPYTKNSTQTSRLFDLIVKFYDQWSGRLFPFTNTVADDGCDNVIATVYLSYELNVRHQELIVRVSEVLARFDGNEQKIAELNQKYKLLFVFYELFVVPAIKNFSKEKRDRVRRLNKFLGTLENIKNRQIMLTTSKVPNEALSSKLTVITTDVPQLFLHDIQSKLFAINGLLFDTNAIFIAPKALQNNYTLKEVTEILKESTFSGNYNQNFENSLQKFNDATINSNTMPDVQIGNLSFTQFKISTRNLLTTSTANNIAGFNVVVDCSKESGENFRLFDEIKALPNIHFIFVISNDNQQLLREFSMHNVFKFDISYNFNDLVPQYQISLVTKTVNFQNCGSISMKSLLSGENSPEDHAASSSNQISPSVSALSLQEPTINNFMSQCFPRSIKFPQISTIEPNLKSTKFDSTIYENLVDNQLLRLLIEKPKIQINNLLNQVFSDDEDFKLIFQSRNFIKKYNKEVSKTLSIEEYQSLKDVKKYKIDAEKSENSKNNRDTIKVIETIQVAKEISIKIMLEEIKNQKFVLISDIAGTGKSWMLRSIANKLQTLNPEKWITFVDLKQFINQFLSHSGHFNFVNFMVEKIIKTYANFELQIFKKLYENGKVLILFDGFDEISPDCAEIVAKLFKSFQQNYGNQLWVTTRDYFEVSLQKELNVDTVYKLDEFTEENGIEIMTSNWVLRELEKDSDWSTIKLKPENELKEIIENSQFFESFKSLAINLVKKIPKTECKKIGYPQFYSIISEIFKDDKTGTITFTLYIIYRKYRNQKFERWSYHEGEIKKRANIEMSDNGMSYSEVHQYFAIEKYFPDKIDFCDLKKDNIGWSKEHIVGFGFLSEKDGKFVFPHETFCEFNAAEFILRILQKGLWTNYEDFFKYFKHFLTTEASNVIRMFINEGWVENSISTKLDIKIDNFANKFDKVVDGNEDFFYLFGEGLENLVSFFIQIFRKLSYLNVKLIFFNNITNIIKMSRSYKIYAAVQDFYIEFLKKDDLEFLVKIKSLVHKTVNSSLDLNLFEQLLSKLEVKIDKSFVKLQLTLKHNRLNILATIVLSDQKQFQNFSILLNILKNYLNTTEIWNLICNQGQINILHMAMLSNDSCKLEAVWQSIKEFCQDQVQPFNKLLNSMPNHNKNRTPLFDTVFRNRIKFHKTLWKLLPTAFEDEEKLKNYILRKDEDGNNFIHMLVSFGDPKIIEFIFEKLKILLPNLYEEIIESKGFENRNLLQKAADNSTNIEVHRDLWKIVRNFYVSEKSFLEFLNETDNHDRNVIFVAADFSTHEVLKFMIDNLEEFAKHEDIKDLLNQKTSFNRNLLQSAMTLNPSYEMHSFLWSIIRKYFSDEEICKMVTETDNTKLKLLQLANKFNNHLVDFTKDKIEEFVR